MYLLYLVTTAQTATQHKSGSGEEGEDQVMETEEMTTSEDVHAAQVQPTAQVAAQPQSMMHHQMMPPPYGMPYGMPPPGMMTGMPPPGNSRSNIWYNRALLWCDSGRIAVSYNIHLLNNNIFFHPPK